MVLAFNLLKRYYYTQQNTSVLFRLVLLYNGIVIFTTQFLSEFFSILYYGTVGINKAQL